MPLNSKQIITTEDLQTYSVCGYNPLVSYVVGNNVKDPITGDIYKCTTNAPAGTLLSDPAYYTPVTSTPLLAATDAQALAMASSAIAVTPANLAALRASSVESAAKTITNKFINPADLAGMNSLALASDTYNASTNSPTLASMKDGDIYKVSTEGIQTIGGVSSFCAVGDLIAKANGATFFMSVNPVSYNAANGQTAGGLTVSFTQLSQLGRIVNITTSGSVTGAIAGAVVGAGSYLIAGDQVQYSSNGLSLVNLEIEPNTTINYGTGSSFGTLGLLNTYINKRSYISLTLNQLSATTETASVDVSNDCDGALSILGNGFTIDFSATANTNCTLAGNNIYIDDFKVKANYAGAYALINKGQLTHSNGFYVENINVTGLGFINSGDVVANSFGGTNGIGGILSTDVVDFRAGATSGIVGYMGVGGKLVAYSIDVKGDYRTGYAATCLTSLTPVTAIVITGAFSNGNCNDLQTSGISCTSFNGGISSSNYIGGAITTGGGMFHGGDNCQTIVNTITGAGATFSFAGGTKLYVIGAISGYTTSVVQQGIGVYNAATSAGVLRNQNTNILQAN